MEADRVTDPRWRAVFHPLGHPVEISTNANDVLDAAAESWKDWPRLFDAPPLRFVIDVHDGTGASSIPAFSTGPRGFKYHADTGNCGYFRIPRRAGRLRVAVDTVRRREWFRYHFLEALVLTALDTVVFTPVHAACVARSGRALLLCGDSGAGKSSLAYACASRGWTFISDDAAHLSLSERGRVIGDCRRIHIRESAVAMFPELRFERSRSMLNGKAALVVETASKAHWNCALSGTAAGCVFLARRPGLSHFSEYDAALAKAYFRDYVRWGDPESQERQYDLLIERGCWRLAYDDLNGGVALLDQLERAMAA
jgi:hypothetical protein